MSKELQISIITVCFNSADHIADALKAVDEQTWPHREHLVIDGASRDRTMEIVREHPQPWRRSISEPDKGIYDAMNKGLRMAQGDVVGFLNSDDLYASRDVLATVAAAFEDPSIDACYGDLCYVDRDAVDSIVRYWRSSPFKPGMFSRGWCPPHPSMFIRRSVLERFGGFDLRYRIAADAELMARLMEVHRVHSRYIPRVLVRMRLGGASNASWTGIIEQNREILRAFTKLGLRVSLAKFAAGKLAMRVRQFLTRPA